MPAPKVPAPKAGPAQLQGNLGLLLNAGMQAQPNGPVRDVIDAVGAPVPVAYGVACAVLNALLAIYRPAFRFQDGDHGLLTHPTGGADFAGVDRDRWERWVGGEAVATISANGGKGKGGKGKGGPVSPAAVIQSLARGMRARGNGNQALAARLLQELQNMYP